MCGRILESVIEQRIAAAIVKFNGYLVAVVLAFVACITGCRSSFENENDVLRARVVDLESQVDQLRHRNAELEAQVRAQINQPTTLPDDVRLNTPHVAELKIERLSFAKDQDGDGRPEQIIVYLKPADGLGRFVQMVGSIRASAALVPMEGEPHVLGRMEADPAAVRNAYRSGLMGTHYTFEIPLETPAMLGAEGALVQVEFHDGLTGRTMSANRLISLK